MNKTEYAEYEAAYARGLEGLEYVSTGACSGCAHCRDDYAWDEETEEFMTVLEPWFSRSACDACGSTLGGDREPMHGADADSKIVHLDVCSDCVYYTEYERLDDATMEDIEA